jgi:hypothetical protein
LPRGDDLVRQITERLSLSHKETRDVLDHVLSEA